MDNSMVLVVLLSLATLCSSNPVGNGEHHVVSQPEQFAGSTTTCRKPNSTYCGVDYAVPDVIATLVNVIEEDIMGKIAILETISCKQTQKDIFCAQSFPRCEGNAVILTSTANCAQSLLSNCSFADLSTGIDVLCGLDNAIIPLGTCSALSSYSDSSETLNYCDYIREDSPVTEWMYKLIQFEDLKIAKAIDLGQPLKELAPLCTDNYAKYFCQFLGECTEDGTKIKVLNDYHFCAETLNCFDHSIADALSSVLPCDLWLDLDYPVPSTQAPTTTQAVTTISSATIEPSNINLPGSGTVPQCTITLAVLLCGLLANLLL